MKIYMWTMHTFQELRKARLNMKIFLLQRAEPDCPVQKGLSIFYGSPSQWMDELYDQSHDWIPWRLTQAKRVSCQFPARYFWPSCNLSILPAPLEVSLAQAAPFSQLFIKRQLSNSNLVQSIGSLILLFGEIQNNFGLRIFYFEI